MKKTIHIRSRFKETSPIQSQAAELPPLKDHIPNAGNRFKVILIEEGLGNLHDCFYYTKKALQGATQVFEGKKSFADHPTSIEESTRPERSTRDILGHFENAHYEEADDGRGSLVADLVVLTNPTYAWAQTLLSTSIGYAKKFAQDFVGLSINASGEANEVSLEEFMKETDIPASVLPKLHEAKGAGISMIRIVNSLKNAVSVDLVTEAGAGGRILSMIESAKKQRKNPMKNKEAFPPAKAKAPASDASDAPAAPATPAPPTAAKEDGEEGAGGPKTGDAEPTNDDADQDNELFAKMIKQYLGDDANAQDPETLQMAKHAYDAHGETGMEPNEAYEAAGNHLKMAMAIGKKMHQKQAESGAHESEAESENATESGGSTADPEMGKKGKGLPSAPGMPPSSRTSGSGPAKESSAHYQAKLIQALGENAKLKETIKKYELTDYLDKKLQESKISVPVTKRFREALGVPKSKEQIDQAYKIFMSGADVGSEDADASFESFVFTEKNSFKQSDAGAEGSMADCMETN